MAKVRVTPVEPLEIEFNDGNKIIALFNNEAFAIFESEFGSLDKIAETEGERTPYEFCAKVLYCGLKVVDRETKLDEVRNIIFSGGIALMNAVMEAIFDNLTAGLDVSTKENFYKEVEKKIKAMIPR